MVCKFEMISENEAYETIYICDKFGDSNRIICNKKIQPNCYEEISCSHESHFISSMDRCEKCGDDRE